MSEMSIKTEPVRDFEGFGDQPEEWILRKAEPIGGSFETYLLSFHDDGVIWGKIKGQALLTSDQVKGANGKPFPSPEFRSLTLQECRLFNENGQLHIWRNGDGNFNGCLFLESENSGTESIEEQQVLWGTRVESGDEDFTIVADGSEGLLHAFPMKRLDLEAKFTNNLRDLKRPLRLRVKHYLDYDEDGSARIGFSRLVTVGTE